MAVATITMLVFIALASRAEILGLLAVIGVSGAIYLVQSRRVVERAKV
jgi:hypothetical protein